MRIGLVFVVLALAGCGPGDGLIRVADGGLANYQCKSGAYVRECDVRKVPEVCKPSSIDPTSRPNGIRNPVEHCEGADCCFWPDGGRF